MERGGYGETEKGVKKKGTEGESPKFVSVYSGSFTPSETFFSSAD